MGERPTECPYVAKDSNRMGSVAKALGRKVNREEIPEEILCVGKMASMGVVLCVVRMASLGEIPVECPCVAKDHVLMDHAVTDRVMKVRVQKVSKVEIPAGFPHVKIDPVQMDGKTINQWVMHAAEIIAAAGKVSETKEVRQAEGRMGLGQPENQVGWVMVPVVHVPAFKRKMTDVRDLAQTVWGINRSEREAEGDGPHLVKRTKKKYLSRPKMIVSRIGKRMN